MKTEIKDMMDLLRPQYGESIVLTAQTAERVVSMLSELAIENERLHVIRLETNITSMRAGIADAVEYVEKFQHDDKLIDKLENLLGIAPKVVMLDLSEAKRALVLLDAQNRGDSCIKHIRTRIEAAERTGR